MDLRLLVKEGIANIGIPLDIFCRFLVLMNFEVLIFCVLGSLQTSVLCIVGELAGEGYEAVAVGVSDM